MKQETLEEAAVRLVKETTLYGKQEASIGSSARSCFETELRCVLLGAKWQQKQDKNKYSEEEVIELLNKREQYLIESVGEFYESNLKWFEQFKKK